MKTRMCVVMLILGCLVAVSVYAAKRSTKAVPPERTAVVPQDPNQKAVLLKTEMDKVSYAIGVQLAQNFKQQEIEIKVEPMMQGLKDATAGKKLALSQDEM